MDEIRRLPRRARSTNSGGMLIAVLPALLLSGCSTSPQATPSISAEAPSSGQPRPASGAISGSVAPALPSTASGMPPAPAPAPPSTAATNAPPHVDPGTEPRVTVDPTDTGYPLKFPPSISEHGDLVASTVGADSASDQLVPVWLRIKKVSTDRTLHLIELLPWEPLKRNLANHCQPMNPTCPYLHDLEERATAVNAVLAHHRWRVFPCYRDIDASGPDRFGAGCENFQDLEVTFADPRLRIVLEGRVLLDTSRPSWAYRDPRGSVGMITEVGPMAYDPETGLLLLWTTFVASAGGANRPVWEFHPLHLPLVRK